MYSCAALELSLNHCRITILYIYCALILKRLMFIAFIQEMYVFVMRWWKMIFNVCKYVFIFEWRWDPHLNISHHRPAIINIPIFSVQVMLCTNTPCLYKYLIDLSSRKKYFPCWWRHASVCMYFSNAFFIFVSARAIWLWLKR